MSYYYTPAFADALSKQVKIHLKTNFFLISLSIFLISS